MCKKFKIFEPVLLQNIDAEKISEFIDNEYEIKITERYIKNLAVETKGCLKCFTSRLQGKVCNERFGENACLYHTWPKDFDKKLKAVLDE